MCVVQHIRVVYHIWARVLHSRVCSVCAGCGQGLLCVWIHGQRAAWAVRGADVLGVAASNDTRGYFAVK